MAARTTIPITVRINPALKDRVNAEAARHPCRPSFTTVVTRGLELALAEMASRRATEADAAAADDGAVAAYEAAMKETG